MYASRSCAATSSAAAAGPGPARAVLAVGDLEPAGQAGLRDAEVLRDLAQRRLTFPGHGDDVSTEVGRKRFRHEIDPSSKDESSQVRSNQNRGSSVF